MTAALPADRHARWRGSLVVFSAVLMVVFVGAPNVRRVFTFLAAALILWPLLAWRRTLLAADAPAVNRTGVRVTAMMLALVSLVTYLTMGIIRETARRPDTVRGTISLEEEAMKSSKFEVRGSKLAEQK
jgi:hypothetical protein